MICDWKDRQCTQYLESITNAKLIKIITFYHSTKTIKCKKIEPWFEGVIGWLIDILLWRKKNVHDDCLIIELYTVFSFSIRYTIYFHRTDNKVNEKDAGSLLEWKRGSYSNWFRIVNID